MENKQFPWIRSAKFDLIWFIAPLILPPIAVFFIPQDFLNSQKSDIFPWSWILIVLTVDVAHVYSTVYKTYFNSEARKLHHLKLLYFPILVWVGGALVYSFGSQVFWTCVAYFAVYHFIRQQYGFFRLYSGKGNETKKERWILNVCLYAVMTIPMLIWHARGQQHFNWMTKGDFVYFNLPSIVPFLQGLLGLVIAVYLFMEIKSKQKNVRLNVPRIALTLSTAFSYYVCIVLCDNDFVFSLVNVLGHGIPYFALVWWSEKRQVSSSSDSILKLVFAKWGWILFYLIVFAMAYFEEALWDALLYRERPFPFGWTYSFLKSLDHPILVGIVVPLLIMPQIVHYILDAYIWRRKDNQRFLEE